MPTLMVCLDSLGYSLLTKENTPYLYNLSKKLYKARLKTLLAFTGVEFTLFTGKSPTQHNIWLEFKYTKNSIFKIYKYLPLKNSILNYLAILHQLLKKRTFITKLQNIPKSLLPYFDLSTTQNIWKTSFFQNKTFICYKWPFFVKNNKIKIDFFKKTDSQKVNKLIKNIQSNVDLYYIHLTELDKFIHLSKIDSRETINKIKQLDNLVKHLVTYFQKYYPNLNIILWSDHNQVNIESLINIQKLMPKSKDYIAFYGGTTISFWFKNNSIKERIMNILKTIKQGKILTQRDRIHYQIPEREYGDLIFLIEPKYLIYPNFYQKSKPFKAMHGYAPDKADLDGFLITNKRIPKILTLEQTYKYIKDW